MPLHLTVRSSTRRRWEPYSVLGNGSLRAITTPRASLVFYRLSFLEGGKIHALKLIPVKEKLFPFLSLDEPIALVCNEFLDCTLRHS